MSDLLKYIAENMTEKDMEQEGEMRETSYSNIALKELKTIIPEDEYEDQLS